MVSPIAGQLFREIVADVVRLDEVPAVFRETPPLPFFRKAIEDAEAGIVHND
jgi:hypothetical protein